MVVNDFEFVRVAVLPDEADAPLVVDADAVPARQAALQGFEAVARRHPQVIQDRRRRLLRELAEGEARLPKLL